jgi:pyrimidine-nucleoside phosphorylase
MLVVALHEKHDRCPPTAKTMVDLGNAVGRKTVAVITDMRQPLGAMIGNRLEIAESFNCFTRGW